MRAWHRKFSRRAFLLLAAGAAALPAFAHVAVAQAYPSRPVRLVVPFAAGGGGDITARLIGQRLSERVGPQFLTENRPGARGKISTEASAAAATGGDDMAVVTSPDRSHATPLE